MITVTVYRCPTCGREYLSRVMLSVGYPKCTGDDTVPGGRKHSSKVMVALGHKGIEDK